MLQRNLVTAAVGALSRARFQIRQSRSGDRSYAESSHGKASRPGDRSYGQAFHGKLAGLVLALLLGAACGPAGPPQDTGLQITDARVRDLVPGRDTTVGYFTAHNPGPEPLVLTGARSDAVRAIEMHVTLRDGDMVRMRRLDEVVVAAGETVRFEPGGRHLMLFGATKLEAPVEIVLLEQDGTAHAVPFRVLAAGEI